MVSRRKILSRSRDDLNLGSGMSSYKDEEDVWYQKEKLYKDHIQEVLGKWESIDDEIWAKVIVLERNRRVAKAYARAPVLTVNGSQDGFDGFRIGVNGFENPLRDPKTEEFKNMIGTGCKLKMDETGNILIKRFSKNSIYIKNTMDENAVSNEIIKLVNGLLEIEKPVKLFDMKKFQQNVSRELKRAYPDRKKLECQCISTIAFVKNEEELLDSPIWIMLINVVALEMLRAKIPSLNDDVNLSVPARRTVSQPVNGTTRKRFPASGSSDEDPYSLTPSGSSGSSGKGNRGESNHNARQNDGRTEKEFFGPQHWIKNQRNDFSDDLDEENNMRKSNRLGQGRKNEESRKLVNNNNSAADDPYYCGLRARVPNFGQYKSDQKNKSRIMQTNFNNNNYITKGGNNFMKYKGDLGTSHPSRSVPNLQNITQIPGAHPFWWHSRLYPDSGMGASTSSGNSGRSNGPIHHFPSSFRANDVSAKSLQIGNYGRRGFVGCSGVLPLSKFNANPRVFKTGWE